VSFAFCGLNSHQTFYGVTSIDNIVVRLLKNYPVVAFIGIAYLWSSVIWISCLLILNVQGANQLFSASLGAFGPAIAGVVVVRAQNRETAGLSIIGFLVGALAAIASCAILALGLTGLKSELYVTAKQPTLSTYLLMVPIVTLSGFIYSHSLAKSDWSRAWFFKMLPDRQTLVLSLGVLIFLPTLLVCSNWMANALCHSGKPAKSKKSLRRRFFGGGGRSDCSADLRGLTLA